MIEALQGIAHASEMLDAVKQGAAIEVFATDDIESFNKVFGEFVRSDAYYELPQERQDYIRDIVVSLATANQQNGDQMAAEMERKMKVFPRQAPQLEVVASQTSPMSQMQTAGQVVDNQIFNSKLSALETQEEPINDAVSANAGAVR